MARSPRFLPEGGALVEVTTRCLQGRFLLRPCPRVKSIMIGVVARAMERTGMEVCWLVALSNHAHIQCVPKDQKQLSDFMRYVNSNIARKVSRLFGWKEKFWGRRYSAIVIVDDEDTQVDRLRYLLEHGVKEDLVSSPLEWPGANAVTAYVDGSFEMRGHWVDHTGVFEDKKVAERTVSPSGKLRSSKVLERELEKHHTTEHKLLLTPIPAWKGLSLHEVSRRIREMVKDIEKKALERHRECGSKPLGVSAVLAQDRTNAPAKVKRSPAPRVHARGKSRAEFLKKLKAFVAAYESASRALRSGKKDPAFPRGCFPPGLPYLEHDPEPAPS